MAIGFHNSRYFLKTGEQVRKGQGYKKHELYGSLELVALQTIGDTLEELKAQHEHTLKGVFEGKRFCFYGDFYIPKKRLCVEIDPGFHTSYKPVAERDVRRDYLLKNVLNVETLRLGPAELANPAQTRTLILDYPDSPGALDYYAEEPIK